MSVVSQTQKDKCCLFPLMCTSQLLALDMCVSVRISAEARDGARVFLLPD